MGRSGSAYLFGQRPLYEVLEHDNEIKPDVPEHRRMMPADLKHRVKLDAFIAAFRRGALVIHLDPFITASRGRGIETDV